MFEYFPGRYSLSLAVMAALELGGTIAEIDEAAGPLRDQLAADSGGLHDAWLDAWSRLGQKILAQAQVSQRNGADFTAASRYRRAAVYFLMAERILPPGHPGKIRAYQDGLRAFRSWVECGADGVESVAVPYLNRRLPALFITPEGTGPFPCLILLNGFDWLKEFSCFLFGSEFRRRGVALLVVDQPGSGESLRLQHLPTRFDMEVPVSASVDYLESRREITRDAIGVGGLSLGGYFAPRAAAFEKRLRCCLVLGASYDAGEVARQIECGQLQESVPHFVEQAMWIVGASSPQEVTRALARFTLEGVLQRIRCPLLVLHGENDRQVPLVHARRTVDEAVNSVQRELRILHSSEGGAEHCAADNSAQLIHPAADWVAVTLGGIISRRHADTRENAKGVAQ